MKGTIKNLTLVATMAVMMSACSTMTTVVEKQQDVVPNWYMKCKDTGTEGWFWWSKDCLLYTSPSPRDLSTSRMPSSA